MENTISEKSTSLSLDIRFVEIVNGEMQTFIPPKQLSEILRFSCLFNICGGRCEFALKNRDIDIDKPLYRLVFIEDVV